MASVYKYSILIVIALLENQIFSKDSTGDLLRIAPPLAGSVGGTYHSLNLMKNGLSKGAFSLPIGMQVDESHGRIMFDPFPVYSPDNGHSEWGQGWQSAIKITRINIYSDITFTDEDDLLTPWGRFIKGNDNHYYSHGLKNSIKIIKDFNQLIALLSDGKKYYFGTVINGENDEIYAWHLTKVVSKEGEESQLTYDRNESGQLFLKSVSYGGRDNRFANRLIFNYQIIDDDGKKIISYKSGKKRVIDRLVTKVSFQRIQNDHTYDTRWYYEITYETPELHTTSFLKSIQRTFYSGHQEPAKIFTYDFLDDFIWNSKYKSSAPLSEIIKELGIIGFTPTYTAFFDYNGDGLLDFEPRDNGNLYIQNKDGTFDIHRMPHDTSVKICGAEFGSVLLPSARPIVRLGGSDSDLVVAFVYGNTFDHEGSTLTVCKMNGEFIQEINLKGYHRVVP